MSSICRHMRWLVQVTAKSSFAYTRFNPACASGFRGGPLFGRKKRCAAQAEYGRLAAQA